MKRWTIWICMCLMAYGFYAQESNLWKKGEADSSECREWVESRLAAMTLKEKIGQLFIHTVAP